MESPKFYYVHCPTCGTQTANHAAADGTVWCQECEQSRAMKPSDMIQGGMRRVQFPPANIQNKIAKQIGEGVTYQSGDQALQNFLANRGRTQ